MKFVQEYAVQKKTPCIFSYLKSCVNFVLANQNAIQNNQKFPLENNLLLPNTQMPFLATHSTHPNYVPLNKCAQERNFSVPPSNNNTHHPHFNGTGKK